MAHATVAGAAAAARPLLGPLVAIDLQARLSLLPTTAHLATLTLTLTLALTLALALSCRPSCPCPPRSTSLSTSLG